MPISIRLLKSENTYHFLIRIESLGHSNIVSIGINSRAKRAKFCIFVDATNKLLAFRYIHVCPREKVEKGK